MPRAPTTADVFNAIAEPRRRQIVELLARRGALAVGTLVVTLGLPQPAVSKHLGVLRKVGVVAVIKQGKQRVYNLEAEKLKTIHDWVKAFEATLDQLGPEGQMPGGKPFPMKIEAWPGGRWYRDLGDHSGHLWGHVQVIKPPTLLEICGPLMMSYPALNHLQYSLKAEGSV